MVTGAHAAHAESRVKNGIQGEGGHTRDISRLIGCKVGSSGIRPAATIGMMAVKILSQRGTHTTYTHTKVRGHLQLLTHTLLPLLPLW